MAGDTRRRNMTGLPPDHDNPKSQWTGLDASQQGLAMKAIGMNCMNYKSPGADEASLLYHYMRNKTFFDENCPDGMRAELMFPSCWNGVDLDPPDHKSHMQYPAQLQDGECPKDFPNRTATLFYETIFQTNLFKDAGGSFIFSNGDPTGFGYHGDFISGWPEDDDLLKKALDTCTDPTGDQTKCPLFEIQSDAEMGLCNLTVPVELEQEDISGPMQFLPGDVPVQPGPAYARKLVGTPIAGMAISSSSRILDIQTPRVALNTAPSSSNSDPIGTITVYETFWTTVTPTPYQDPTQTMMAAQEAPGIQTVYEYDIVTETVVQLTTIMT